MKQDTKPAWNITIFSSWQMPCLISSKHMTSLFLLSTFFSFLFLPSYTLLYQWGTGDPGYVCWVPYTALLLLQRKVDNQQKHLTMRLIYGTCTLWECKSPKNDSKMYHNNNFRNRTQDYCTQYNAFSHKKSTMFHLTQEVSSGPSVLDLKKPLAWGEML